MTSGSFSHIPVASIWVDRAKRQRRELDESHITELADSIRKNGLINPITITREYELVAGECRLTAHQLLKFETIAVQFVEDLSEYELQLIELEENVRRQSLTWQDQAAAVARFHQIKAENEEGWTLEKTSESLGISESTVRNNIMVVEAIEEGVKEVAESDKFSSALNFAKRRHERRKAEGLRSILPQPKVETAVPDVVLPQTTTISTIPKNRHSLIIQENFKTWSEQVQTRPFNLIHCDFPYGVNAGDKKGQSGAKNFGGYEDTPEIYFDLLSTFCKNQDNFVAPQAHMIFWFSLLFYSKTIEILEAAGWRVDRFPLIWHRTDNSGILPDANRGPRRTYETALFCTRGDRKIVRAKANSVGAPTTKEYHMSEKPKPVLEHFFRMLIDDTSRVLDPTCGSGNAIAVAEALGASFSLGMDINEEYVTRAKENLDL